MSLMSHEENELRARFRRTYGEAVYNFYNRIIAEGFTDKELAAVPALFLPGCGNLYAQSLVKVAIVGEGTNGWGYSLLADLNDIKFGKYKLESTFEALQNESMDGNLVDGPTKWRNQFWKAVAEVLNSVYATHSALENCSPIFRGVAWSNSYPIEEYKSNGHGGKVDKNAISPGRHKRIQTIADDCGISSFNKFIEVFRPNVIIYTLHNRKGSNRVFPKDAKQIDIIKPMEGNSWIIKVYRVQKTLIVQTQHPSWVIGRKHVGVGEFGRALAKVLIKNNLFAPPAKEHFYWDIKDKACQTFSQLLNAESLRITHDETCVDMKIMSYKLVLALADHLRLVNSTMTAALMVKLLNTVNIFEEKRWQYSNSRRGPCAVAAGACRYYNNIRNDPKSAAKIAEAFTKLNGGYAYE